MIVGILCFAFEIILIATTTGLGNNLTEGYAWFVIISFILCTVISFLFIFVNASLMKGSISKGRNVTGLVFSIVSFVLGMIFCIVCFVTMAS